MCQKSLNLNFSRTMTKEKLNAIRKRGTKLTYHFNNKNDDIMHLHISFHLINLEKLRRTIINFIQS